MSSVSNPSLDVKRQSRALTEDRAEHVTDVREIAEKPEPYNFDGFDGYESPPVLIDAKNAKDLAIALHIAAHDVSDFSLAEYLETAACYLDSRLDHIDPLNRSRKIAQETIAEIRERARQRKALRDWRGRLRDQVLERDGQCLACGSREHLCADHIVPLSCGGTESLENLQTLYRSCNSRKGTKTIDYRGARA